MWLFSLFLFSFCIVRTKETSRKANNLPQRTGEGKTPTKAVKTTLPHANGCGSASHRTYSTAPWAWTSSTSRAPCPCTPATAALSGACISAEVGPILVSGPQSHHYPVWPVRAGWTSEAYRRGIGQTMREEGEWEGVWKSPENKPYPIFRSLSVWVNYQWWPRPDWPQPTSELPAPPPEV